MSNDDQTEGLEYSDDAVIGKAFKASLVALVLLAGGVGGFVWWNNRPKPVEAPVAENRVEAGVRAAPKIEPPTVKFVDVTKESGVSFTHVNGATGKKLLPETMGSGVAVLDYNNDGRPDLLFVNSCPWPWENAHPSPKPTLKLYRNDGKMHFTDVTVEAGLDVVMFGMGVAVGDYDNDGWVDVYVTGVAPISDGKKGANRLFKNAKGRFRDVTDAAGVAGLAGGWGTSCALVDVDNDGKLDLVVLNYVEWTREFDASQPFTLVGSNRRGYGRPTEFSGSYSLLYHNDGNGKFTEIGEKAGLRVLNPATKVPVGKGLGVVPIDMDGDGWIDLVVANDMVQNFVFHNQKDGTFKEIGAQTQIAFDSDGKARGAMGIDAAYYRNDGMLAVGIGNFANEPTAVYISQPENPLLFKEATISCGIGPPSRVFLKFGLFFFDYDLDGRLDMFEANGHLENEIKLVQESQTYAQPAQLFWNAGPEATDEFIDVSVAKCGEDLKKPMVGRGAAYADLDGDGDLDVVLTACGGPARILRNDQQTGNRWIRLSLVGTGPKCNRDAIGAWIEATVGGQKLRRQVMPTRSYLSQVELPVTIGIGKATKVDSLRIVWPDRTTQEVSNVAIDKPMIVKQQAGGAGREQASR